MLGDLFVLFYKLFVFSNDFHCILFGLYLCTILYTIHGIHVVPPPRMHEEDHSFDDDKDQKHETNLNYVWSGLKQQQS